MPLHNQLLVNGYTNRPLKKEEDIIAWMKDLVGEIDMKIIQGPYASYVSKKGNKGLTCVVMIETSHIALHVWDEPKPAELQFDLYTCSTLPVNKVLLNLQEKLGLYDYKYIVLERETGFNIVKKGKDNLPDNSY